MTQTKKKQARELGFWKPLAIIALIVLFFEVILFFAIGSTDSFSFEDKTTVAVVPLFGNVVSEQAAGTLLSSPSQISAQRIIPLLHDLDNDPTIDAIILQVNSGGGYPVPSHKIAQAVDAVNKPIVVVVEDVSASGAYFISSAADYIVADDYSVIGSIGVVGSYLDFSEFIKEYNVSYQRLVGGKYKDSGSPFKKLTVEEKAMLQRHIDLMHDLFIEDVAHFRNMSISRVKALATGEVFLGREAQEVGLIDAVGGSDLAESYLKEKLGVDDVVYSYYNKPVGLLDSLFSVKSSSLTDVVSSSEQPVALLR